MLAIGGDEIDDRCVVLQVMAEIIPALVRAQVGVVRLGIDLVAEHVQRRHAGVPTARNVDGCQVQRLAEQAVTQRAGDELVDLVAGLRGHAVDDAGGAGRREADRVGEGRQQSRLCVDGVAGGIDRRLDLQRLVQHRVAEAIDGVGELGRDGGIEVDVGVAADMDGRHHLAGEFLEHEVLVFRLDAVLGGLEQPSAVEFGVGDDVSNRIAIRIDAGRRQIGALEHPVQRK